MTALPAHDLGDVVGEAGGSRGRQVDPVELAQLARVRRLVLFHHEPACDDARIEQVLGETIRYEEISRNGHKVEIVSAYDGLELAV